jgi:hypothetical protein
LRPFTIGSLAHCVRNNPIRLLQVRTRRTTAPTITAQSTTITAHMATSAQAAILSNVWASAHMATSAQAAILSNVWASGQHWQHGCGEARLLCCVPFRSVERSQQTRPCRVNGRAVAPIDLRADSASQRHRADAPSRSRADARSRSGRAVAKSMKVLRSTNASRRCLVVAVVRRLPARRLCFVKTARVRAGHAARSVLTMAETGRPRRGLARSTANRSTT